MRGWAAFCDYSRLSYGSFAVFFDKKNVNLKFSNIFCQKTSLHNLQKVLKTAVSNTMAADL